MAVSFSPLPGDWSTFLPRIFLQELIPFFRLYFMAALFPQRKRITFFLTWSSFLCSCYNIWKKGVSPLKVNEYQQPDLAENRIDFYYRKKNKEVHDILSFLKKHSQRLLGKAENSEMIFSLDEVFYFESVDKKTFACLEKKSCRWTHAFRI